MTVGTPEPSCKSATLRAASRWRYKKVNRFLPTLLLAGGVLAAAPGHALQIISVTPQGEVARVRQVVAKFDQPAVNFGDPKAPAPLTVSCNDAQAAKGTGRWTDAKAWVYDFENDLPPGVRCTVTRIPTFKPASGELTGPERYQFNTGGPFVRNYMPGSYSRIDEQQMFMLELNGAATLESVRQNVWCTADGVGERIPVKLLDGEQRTGLYFSLWGMVNKAAVALGVLLATNGVTWFGFDPAIAENTASAKMSVALLYSVGPAILACVALPLLWKYPLSKQRQERMRSHIERRDIRPRLAAEAVAT